MTETIVPFESRCKKPHNPAVFKFTHATFAKWKATSQRMQNAEVQQIYELLRADNPPKFVLNPGPIGASHGEEGTASLFQLCLAELESRKSEWNLAAKYAGVVITNCFLPRDGGHHMRAEWSESHNRIAQSTYQLRPNSIIDWRWYTRMLAKALYHAAVELGLYKSFSALPCDERILNQDLGTEPPMFEFIVIGGWFLAGEDLNHIENLYPDPKVRRRRRAVWRICGDLIDLQR